MAKMVQRYNETIFLTCFYEAKFQVFIYFARYLKGNVQEGNGTYKWSDRNELGKLLHPDCHKAVLQFLITE